MLAGRVSRDDLLLSPDHAIFIDGVLIPAGLLVNGVSILPAHDVPRPRYWHVELDAHDILFAEGLPVESFLDTGQRNGFADGSGVVMLSPGFSLDRVAQIWETLAAASSLICTAHAFRLSARNSRRILGFRVTSI